MSKSWVLFFGKLLWRDSEKVLENKDGKWFRLIDSFIQFGFEISSICQVREQVEVILPSHHLQARYH